MALTSYELSRVWFDFCFENPDKISPNHSALYFFCIEHCNRLGWKEKFGLPSQMAMDAIGIKNWRTYSNTFNDLEAWGFIKVIQRSKNQYSATVIAIVKNTKADTKALSKAIQKHSQKQYKSIVGIDKPYNHITNNNDKEIFETFRKSYTGTKKGLETEYLNFTKKTSDFKAVLPLLMPALIRLTTWRAERQRSGQFCPEMPHLSTWINQRRWEEELQTETLTEKTDGTAKMSPIKL